MWELSASQSESFRVFVTPFTLSSTTYLFFLGVKLFDILFFKLASTIYRHLFFDSLKFLDLLR